MPNIFDNLSRATSLGPALRHSLEEFSTVDVATGYLDLRGWGEFSDVIERKKSDWDATQPPLARVLVGMIAPADSQQILDSLQATVEPPKYGADVHDSEKATARRSQLVRHLRNQLMRGLPTLSGQATLRMLKEQLRAGVVEMKVFTEKPLHGKTYIFNTPGKFHGARWAYVGSSNLTGAGLNRNLELNIDVQDSDATEKLADWFNERWDDPFSLPINSQIIELIEESWADEQQPTPFEVYLRVCHALSQDAREGLGYVLPKSMEDLLLNYQTTAVRTLARRVVRRNGTMLGDVVGLGKTMTAVATALMLEAAEDYNTLVLCPKNLEKMWVDHLERYDVNGRVIPYSMADKILPDAKRYNLVICDESHNLRSNSTIAYQAIRDYVKRNTSKVLLLTATPYNLAFSDVANQIGLYIDDDDDLGIIPSAAIRDDPNLPTKVDGKINTLAAFRRSEKAEDWRRLMSDHLVRRTRSFIRRTAKKERLIQDDGTTVEREYLEFASGERFRFPTRVARPISHEFGSEDPAGIMESDATLDAVRQLKLPRYRLAEYDNPRARHSAEDRDIISDIRAGRGNVSAFVRVGLFKRLSSSGHSFIISLQRQYSRNEVFIHALDNSLPLPIGTFSDKQMLSMDDDSDGPLNQQVGVEARYHALERSLPIGTKWVDSRVFKASLRHDLNQDNDTIAGLLAHFGEWDYHRDSKIQALVDLLSKEHAGDKVVIFTEYSDTATYVAEALQDSGIGRVGLVTGQTDNPTDIVRRFSPLSNRLPGESVGEAPAGAAIDVLVATDVLSEGQNLQDAHVVVNYDLPWAIIRIIQRAGRVDRVGQVSDRVFVYLITHEKIEQAINLRQRIKDRLGASADAFGSDEQFFGSDREIRVLDDFYNGRVDDEHDSESEADAVSEAWLVWCNAQQEHPEAARRALAMQDLVHTTRDPYMHEKATGVACYISTEAGVDAFGMSRSDHEGGGHSLLTPLEALSVFRAEPETPSVVPRDDLFSRQKELLHGPLALESIAAGNLRGIRKWVWERLGGNTLFNELAAEALAALHARPLTGHATQRLVQARRNKYSLEDLAALVQQLNEEDRLVITASADDHIRLVCSIGVTDR